MSSSSHNMMTRSKSSPAQMRVPLVARTRRSRPLTLKIEMSNVRAQVVYGDHALDKTVEPYATPPPSARYDADDVEPGDAAGIASGLPLTVR